MSAEGSRRSAGSSAELWEALDYLQDVKFADSVSAGDKRAVPVQPVLRVMAKHMKDGG